MRVFNIFVNIAISVTCYGRGALPIYDGRLDSDLDANNFSITNLYSLDVKNVPWVTTNQLDTALEGIVTEETDYIALPVINAHLADRDNPHNVTPDQIGAIPGELKEYDQFWAPTELDGIGSWWNANSYTWMSGEMINMIYSGTYTYMDANGIWWDDERGAARWPDTPTDSPLIKRDELAQTNTLLQAAIDLKADATALANHTGNTSNPHEVTPAQIGAVTTNQLTDATNGMLTAEADTLATVTARGATTTSAITAQNFIGGRYGVGAGESAYGTRWGAYGENAGSYATGDDWGAYGSDAGSLANGDYWGAYGVGAGLSASGNYWGAYGAGAGLYANGDYWGAYGASAGESATGNGWGAYGVGAGSQANGDYWGAYGRMAGYGADHNNSHAFGQYAGYAARGDSRLYVDVYETDPQYAADGAINDRIFGDTDGTLYLGRGEGAPGGAVGGTLRGPWTGGGFATASVVTGIVERLTTSLSHPYILQGSTVVPLLGATLTLSGNAQHGPSDTIQLIPWQATRPTEGDSLGTLTITSLPTEYIVDIVADIHVTPLDPNQIPGPNNDAPVTWRSKRVSDTEWQVSAWAPGGPAVNQPLPGAGYYATLSNLVVQTFDRPGYWPNTITNDTAALPTYTDTTDIRKADPRRVPTASGVRDYVESRKREIAQYAWRLTPSGKVAPSPNFVTMDLPLIQQGNIAFLQQGNYYVMSYEGGDWRSESTGSSWQIGASGRADLKITAESRMGHIRDFIRTAETCMIYASTNWMAAASTNGTAAGADPYIEWTYTLDNPQWLDSPDAVRSYHTDAVNGDYYLFTIACDAPSMFFRVMIPGSERRIISAPTHKFLAGIELGDDLLTDLLAAKAEAEQVVSGAVGTASAGNRYFWTSATNVVLSVNLTSGQVVNLAKLNNTATNSITAIGQAGWEWTGGDMTNTIAAGKSMTFGFLIDAATGRTNAYATGVSK